MRKRLTDLGEIVGAGLVAVGFGLWSLPAGLVAGGASMILACWLVGE